MPRAVQHVQEKAIEDGPLATGTVHHHSPAPGGSGRLDLPLGPRPRRCSLPLLLAAAGRVRSEPRLSRSSARVIAGPGARLPAVGWDWWRSQPHAPGRAPQYILGGCWPRLCRAAFPGGGGAGTFPHFQAVPILIFVWPPPNSRILIQIW